MESLPTIPGSLFVVALLWGISNPFMKIGTRGLGQLKKTNSFFWDLLQEYYYMLTSPIYLTALLVNISGSVLFYYALSNQQISQIVTITNSLTYLVTTVTSKLLGEQGINKYTYIGMCFVILGVSICVVSKDGQ
eukprot:TRINITY_DN4216_c0_g1_i1.p1 TRINITY_DN4216_c0_g1~~TRINITY_DN4216_c0_g1_i1.p1  ORF type:complete len:134 (+),score=15.97 TRINITY_DN4216_c0_g1_i1:48-449(+)